MNGYELSKGFWDWAFENPEKISPNHCAIYFFAIEHCNRLGWKTKFGFPSQMTMDAIGIKKHSTYISYFNDLVDWGFFILIQKSKNQYSSNIISLSNALPKKGKALGKAMLKHGDKHEEKQKAYNKTLNTKPQINIEERKTDFKKSFTPFLDVYSKSMLIDFFEYWSEHGENDKKMRFEKEKSFSLERRLKTWKKNESKFNTNPNESKQQQFIQKIKDY